MDKVVSARIGVLLGLVVMLGMTDGPSLDSQITAVLEEPSDGVVASVWVGDVSGDPLYTRSSDTILPTASAIKTAFLIELFAKYGDALDQPPPGVAEILNDSHPAVAPFTKVQREEIRKALSGASVRKIGGIMMGSEPASIEVYNAAANVATALLGGPESLTRTIRERYAPAPLPLAVRRYMLAPRNVSGDNEASAAALATIMRILASGSKRDVPEKALEAAHGTVLISDNHLGLKGRHHVKEGALNSDPLVRVQSGWWETPGGPTRVYVVMLSQPNPGKHSRENAGVRLDATCKRITALVLGEVSKSSRR